MEWLRKESWELWKKLKPKKADIPRIGMFFKKQSRKKSFSENRNFFHLGRLVKLTTTNFVLLGNLRTGTVFNYNTTRCFKNIEAHKTYRHRTLLKQDANDFVFTG